MARRRRGSGTAKGARRAAKLQKRKRKMERKRGAGEFGSSLPPRWFSPVEHGSAGESNAWQARELMAGAWECEDHDEQVALVRALLERWPDCPQAYVLLGHLAPSPADAVPHFTRAVELADRELGDVFGKLIGEFGEHPETRLCLEFRRDLAACLWGAGRREQAIERWAEMLWLDSEDSRGVRWGLACRLVQLGRLDEAAELIAQFDEPFAVWSYLKALLTFEEDGDTPAARSSLEDGVRLNAHFVPYLAGHKLLPEDFPAEFERGRESEALACLGDLLPAWRRVPGALPWLRRVLNLGPCADDDPLRDEPAPMTARRRAEVSALPQCDEVWLVYARALPIPSPGEEEQSGQPPWILCVVDLSQGRQLATEFEPEEPSASRLRERLFDVMQSPGEGAPRRPACVEFAAQRWLDGLLEDLQEFGISVRLGDTQQIDSAFQDFLEHALRPSPADERPLGELPRHEQDVWQIDVRRLRTWINYDGEMRRPWAVVVYSPATKLVLATRLTPDPSLAIVWETLEEAIRNTRYGEAHRPGCVEVCAEDARTALAPRLDELEIRCAIATDVREFDAIFEELSRSFGDSRPFPGLLDVPGGGSEAAGRVFEAACEFYLRAPWQHVAGDRFLRVEVADRPSQTWFACVMGQSGMVNGLALYDNPREIEAVAAGAIDRRRHHETTSAVTLTFGEEFEMSFEDLEAAVEYGWPVAAPEAWPSAYRVRPGMQVEPLSTTELAVLEGCLRVIPDFIGSRRASREVAVDTSGGILRLRLSWYE